MTAPSGSSDSNASRRTGAGRRPVLPAGLGGIQAVVDAVPEAVLLVEPDGALRLTNEAADRLFAGRPVRDREDLLSRLEPVEIDRPERLPASPDRPDSRGDAVIVRERTRPNRWYALRTVALDDAGADAAVQPGSLAFVLRDVTDTRDLRPTRDAFLGLVSHELRTPITTIYAGSTVLARQPSLSMPATRTLAHDVSAEAARLYDVVEDLLVLGRIERHVLDPLDAPVRLEQVIDSTIRIVSERETGARIDRHGPPAGAAPIVRGDATYVEQALRNLLLAVIRRAGQAVPATIEIALRPDVTGSHVELTIADRGASLGDGELAFAFDLPEVSRPAPKLGGLGTYVARQMVEAMGGRVSARDRGDGTGIELVLALRAGRSEA